MKSEKEIREMLKAKKKQAVSKIRPEEIRRLDAACAIILEWVLD